MEIRARNHHILTQRESGAASKPVYLPALDSLRFFAFFSVFLTHTLPTDMTSTRRGLPSLVGDLAAAGRFGVDLFFVLSGYLITDPLLEKERFSRVIAAPSRPPQQPAGGSAAVAAEA